MKVDVYSMLDGWIVDRMADDIAEALAKNGYDVSCVSWDIDCNVHDLNEDLQTNSQTGPHHAFFPRCLAILNMYKRGIDFETT